MRSNLQYTLLFLLATQDYEAMGSETSLNRHLAVVQQIPRVPLGVVKKLMHERRLPQIDMGLFGEDGADVQCSLNDDNGSMDCKLLNGEDEYEMHETCTFGDDGEFRMGCTVCTDSTTGDDFRFCYETKCDFTALLGGANDVISLADVESNVCTCVYAKINGQDCDYCGICDIEDDEDRVKDTMLFTNLALECPHMDLVSSSCNVPGRQSSGGGARIADDNVGQITSVDPTLPDGESGTVVVPALLVLCTIAALSLLARFAFRVKKKRDEQKPTFPIDALEDVEIL